MTSWLAAGLILIGIGLFYAWCLCAISARSERHAEALRRQKTRR